MHMFELAWIIVTLVIVTLASSIARKWGPGILVGLVAICIITANILATKIIRMFGLLVPAGVIVYSISFLLTDALSEFYGRRQAVRAVWVGFFANIVFLCSVFIVLRWPHAFGEEADEAFQKTLSFSVRITFAALVTYLISQFHDVFAFDYWGRLTKGKYLWLRNNASTVVSQTLDTCIFISIAFWGIMPIGKLIIGQLAIKAIVALLDTPFLYTMKMLVFKSPEYDVFAKGKEG